METEIAELKVRMAKIENQMQKPKTLSQDLADNVTAITGLKEALTNENRLLKRIWIFLFFIGISATMFYFYQTIDEYLKNPTATEIKLEGANDHEFPPLLLCLRAWFQTDKALKLGLSLDAFKYSISYLTELFPDQLSNISRAKSEFFTFYDLKKFESLLDYHKSISPDFEIETSDRNSSSKFSYHCRGCRDSRIVGISSCDGRLCYVFNLNPMKKGLGVYSDLRKIKLWYQDLTGGLMRDVIFDWDLYFNPNINSLVAMYPKVTIQPFTWTLIKFYEQKFIMIDKPETPCRDDRNYSSIICMTQCHNEIYQEYLSCRLMWLSLLSKPLPPNRTCNFFDRYPPENLQLMKFFDSKENALIDSKAAEECVERCPRECARTIFNTDSQLKSKYNEADQKNSNETIFRITVELKHTVVYQGGVNNFE